MNLLSLPLWQLVANLLGIALCLFVLFVCVCRINVSAPTRWRLTSTQAMLICFALWAAGTIGDLWHGRALAPHEAAAGAGIVLYVAATYAHWLARERIRLVRAARAPDGEDDRAAARI